MSGNKAELIDRLVNFMAGPSTAANATKAKAKTNAKAKTKVNAKAAEGGGAVKSGGAKRTKSIAENAAKGGAAASASASSSSSGGVAAGTLGRGYEEVRYKNGFEYVIGVDEAGRGPLAGPVVAAACVVPPSVVVEGITDSKAIKAEAERERLYEELVATPGVVWAASIIGSERIDEVNILEATLEAMTASVLDVKAQLNGHGTAGVGRIQNGVQKGTKRDSNGATKASRSGGGGAEGGGGAKCWVAVDGNKLPPPLNDEGASAEFVIKGDGKVYSIAAASIIAKVTRDRIMNEHDQKWPVYLFGQHKGYGTKKHMEAIAMHGPCEIHRRSFTWPGNKPVKKEKDTKKDKAAEVEKKKKKKKGA